LDCESNCIFQENIDPPEEKTFTLENTPKSEVENHAESLLDIPKAGCTPIEILESTQNICEVTSAPIELPALVLEPAKNPTAPIAPPGTFQKAIARRKVRFK
jgi:hypothetical protein